MSTPREVAPDGDIDPEVARKAELFECYCGRTIIIAEIGLCEGCGKVPEKCNCKELP
jgi:hypothetical protein